MKTRIILAVVLLALCTPAFAQFGRYPYHHHHHHGPYGGPYGPIEYRWGHYYDQYGYPVSPDYLGISLYGSEYLRARRQVGWGSALTTGGIIFGLSAVIGGAIQADYNRQSKMMMDGFNRYDSTSSGVSAAVIAQGLLSVACLGIGIPLWSSGNRAFYRIADDYNRRYGNGYGYAPSLSLGSSPSGGVGLSLRF